MSFRCTQLISNGVGRVLLCLRTPHVFRILEHICHSPGNGFIEVVTYFVDARQFWFLYKEFASKSAIGFMVFAKVPEAQAWKFWMFLDVPFTDKTFVLKGSVCKPQPIDELERGIYMEYAVTKNTETVDVIHNMTWYIYRCILFFRESNTV